MKHKNIFVFLLTFFLIAHIFISFQAINNAQVNRFADEAHYLATGIDFYKTIFTPTDIAPYFFQKDFSKTIRKIFTFQASALGRPPLLFLFQAIMWKILEVFGHRDVTIMILAVNYIFMTILIFSCYGIGSILYERRVGFLAACMVLTVPLIFEQSRSMMTDFPLTAMLCLSIFLLLKTQHFENRFFSVVLGMIIGFSLLFRETFMVYFSVPFLWYCVCSYAVNSKVKRLKNLFITLFFALLIAGPLYINPENFEIYKKWFLLSQLKTLGHNDLLFYVKSMPAIFGYLILFTTAPLFLMSIIWCKKKDMVLWAWLVTVFLSHVLILNKACRFIMPMIPAYCVLVSSQLYRIKLQDMIKKIMFLFLLMIFLAQFVLMHYFRLPKYFAPSCSWPGIRNMHVVHQYPGVHEKLLQVFKRETNSEESKIVLFIYNVLEINGPFSYKALLLKNILLYVNTEIEADAVDSPEPNTVVWEGRFLRADYLVDKVGGDEGCAGARENIRALYKEALNKHADLFEVIATIPVEYDDSQLIVYRKRQNT
jgi:hypothetical protein